MKVVSRINQLSAAKVHSKPKTAIPEVKKKVTPKKEVLRGNPGETLEDYSLDLMKLD